MLQNVAVLCVRCRDQALSVRKQAIMSLTEVLSQFQTNPDVQSAWLKGVLPTVWDQETSIQDKCVDILDTVILSNMVPAHRTKSADHTMAWELLTLISKPDNTDLRRSLKKVCRLWERQKKLTTSLISAIFSHIGTRNNQAAWSFLSDVCMSKVKVDMKPVLKYWTDHHHTITGETEVDVWENVLRIIGLNAPAIASDLQLQLIDEFKEHLLRFDLQTGLVSALASAASQLSKAWPGVTFESGQEWGRDVLVACDHHLSAIVLDEDSSSDVPCDETKTMCYLFTLGMVALHCPSLTPKRAAMLVQSFVAAPCITDEGDQTDSLTSASQPVNASQGSEVSAEGSHGSQRSQVTQSSQGTQLTQLSQFRGCKMSGPIRAIAFLTLGKLCLQDKAVAKKCVPAMARELDISTSEASDMVRNNIVVILRDLCVRYATLVDPYLPVVATCLRDPAPIVRRQTLELLTGLLQEDYLKWKGALFFRFMVTLLDPHPDIVAFAEYCLGIHLMKRHPTMMSQHLLESIFVFNDYTKHNVFNKYTQSEREKLLFSLKGKENHSQRMKLYRFMLEHMEDEHRFPLMAKISQEVLGAVVDGDVVYDEESCQLLQDALAILSCKEIKLTSLRSTRSVEDASDEMEMATVVMATAKKTLLTQVVKKNLKDEVIPIVLSLKHRLERERSPLLKDLMLFFRELMKDFKNEIKDILSEDKQLACEVEYDLRQFDKQQTEGAEQGQATPAAATPVQTANGSGTPAAGQPQSKPSTSQVGSARKNAPTPAAGKNTPVPARRDSSDTAGPSGVPPSSQTDIAKATRHAVIQMMENHKRRLSSGGEDQERQRRRLSMVKLAENVLSTSGQENTDSTPEKQKMPQRAQTGRRPETTGQQQTPQQRRRPLRAISTPSGLLSNVTFAGESNMTLPLVPPSPIPGHTKSPEEDTSAEEVNIVYMDMPGMGQSKPREWHVKVKSEEQVEEMAQPVVVTSPVVSRSRRSRRSNKSSS
ncbi:hypothetical protein V1264_002597 [Littorina saxatilis]|uniref:Condensin complex subunit 1 C-terminal domain-containing protein n=1 Tax=Littorina saxatilis TaxID=31220 RepID=A0AAN9B5Q1_9CAEN